MKKLLATLLIIFLMLNTTFADDKTKIELLDKQVTYNDKQIQFLDTNSNPIYPIYSYGDVYLPVRSIADIIGKNIKYDANTKSIYLYGKKEPVINYNIVPLNTNDKDLFAIYNATKIYLDDMLISKDTLSFNNVVYVNIWDLYLYILDYVHYDNEYSKEITLKDANSFTEYNLTSLVCVSQISFGLRYKQIDGCKDAFKKLKNLPIPANYPYTKELEQGLNQLEKMITKFENEEIVSFSDFTVPFANLAIIYVSKDYDAYLENIYGFKNNKIASGVYALNDEIEDLVANLEQIKKDKVEFENLKKLEVPKNLKYSEKIITDNLNNVINHYKIVISKLENYDTYLNKDAKHFIAFENSLKKDIDNLYDAISKYEYMFNGYYQFFENYFMM